MGAQLWIQVLIVYGIFSHTTSKRIVGGEVVDISTCGWQVSLQDGEEHLCGGSIINKNWIVTSAQCVQDGDTNDLTIRTGSSYHNSNGNVYEVTDIVLHPKFNIRTFDYDVALVKVKNPIKLTVCNSRPVNLANEQYETPVGSLVYVTGWGANQTEGNDSSELLGAWIPLIDSSVCQSNYAEPGKPDRITDRMLCAGSAKGDGFCHGDYGGPLVDKNRKLIGIVSWGTHCGQSDKPGVYTKVNHPEILEFILTKSSD